jgi:Domain of unknown function (DUF4386)
MNATRKQARFAGLLYLILALTAPIGLELVPGAVIVAGNAAATADHLRTSEALVRLGIGSELFHQVVEIFLVLALYRLFKTVDEHLAQMLVILGALVSVPIVFLNVLNEIAALIAASGSSYLSVFDKGQLDAISLFFLTLHGHGIFVAQVFWGLWLFPFGLLVIKSGFMPRWLGVSLLVAGVGYVTGATVDLMLPGLIDATGSLTTILTLGELPIVIWLVVWGAREQHVH